MRGGTSTGLMGRNVPLSSQENAMRTMAEEYLRLAKTSFDRTERKKFLDYAALYAELSDRSVRKRRKPLFIARARLRAFLGSLVH